MKLSDLKIKRIILKEVLALLLWCGMYRDSKTVGELEEDYNNGNIGLGDSLNELKGLGYKSEVTLKQIDEEFEKIDTGIFNLNYPNTYPEERIGVDENFNLTYF